MIWRGCECGDGRIVQVTLSAPSIVVKVGGDSPAYMSDGRATWEWRDSLVEVGGDWLT